MAKKPRPASPAAGQPATSPAGEPKPKACSILPDTVLGDDVALVAENMERILSSPSYSLAMEDPSLLQKVEMRGVRMLLELGKPELALHADNIVSTVIVFGGTQIVERGAATRRLSEARRAADAAPHELLVVTGSFFLIGQLRAEATACASADATMSANRGLAPSG